MPSPSPDEKAVEAAAKALWDSEKHRSPWLSEAVTEVDRRLRRIAARKIVAAYTQALAEREPDARQQPEAER
jgi:hypothetical protein